MQVDASHPATPGAPPKQATLWRYMSLTKLLYLLVEKKLAFPRMDSMAADDPFEGRHSNRTMKELEEAFNSADFPQMTPEQRQRFSEMMFADKTAEFFVSCWHEGRYESAALWRLYATTGEGVAVRTTMGDLTSGLQDDGTERTIFIGRVEYIDFDTDRTALGNVITPFFRKRRSFEHEHEVRLLYWDPMPFLPENIPPDGIPRPPSVVNIGINPEKVIAEIVVSPYASSWVVSTISKTVTGLGYTIPTRKSDLLTVR